MNCKHCFPFTEDGVTINLSRLSLPDVAPDWFPSIYFCCLILFKVIGSRPVYRRLGFCIIYRVYFRSNNLFFADSSYGVTIFIWVYLLGNEGPRDRVIVLCECSWNAPAVSLVSPGFDDTGSLGSPHQMVYHHDSSLGDCLPFPCGD